MGLVDHLSVEQLERADWSEFTTAEKVTLAGELYHRAPAADAYVKRVWVARLLGLPLKQLNCVLWQTAGIRWPMVLPKNPPGGRRGKRTGGGEPPQAA
jgi:hypothetical protein